MKTRNGFVSNSSSSSFVIGLKKKPVTIEQAKAILFPLGSLQGLMAPYDDVFYSADQVAASVLANLADAEPMTREQLIEEINSGWYEGRPEYPANSWGLKGKAQQEAWDKHDEDCEKAAGKVFDQSFGPRMGELEFYKVEYSDNDGPFQSSMEHGDVFRNVFHVKISHH